MGQSFPFGKAILGIVGCFDLFKQLNLCPGCVSLNWTLSSLSLCNGLNTFL